MMITRKIEERDLPLRVDWMNNPKTYESMHFQVPVTLENTILWFRNNFGNLKRVDLAFEDNGSILAFGGLTNINRETDKAELYVFVNPDCHRGGIGSNVTKALCKYGFEMLKLHKIYLETNEDNIAARSVYEKCGFKLEGIHRAEYKSKEGVLLNRLYYGLIKGELNE